MEKKVEVKYNNMGYFENRDLAKIRETFEIGLRDIEVRKASGFWVLVEGTPKEDGLQKILAGLEKRERGVVSIKFKGYTPKEIAQELSKLEGYNVEIEVSKYFG